VNIYNPPRACRAAALHQAGIIIEQSFLIADDLRSGALVEAMPRRRSLERRMRRGGDGRFWPKAEVSPTPRSPRAPSPRE
jgi:hypothetical protein